MLRRKKTDRQALVKKGISAGLVEIAVIILIAFFFIASETLMPAKSGSLVLGIAAVLVLLVIGAAIAGILVFGWPLYLALQKKYYEAVLVFCCTLATLLAFFLLIVLAEILIF
ncbi:MAG TPA: hypothetical protein PKL09_01630 [bacterium]|nr:hypothetical protein [bacterium]HNS33626.1 hypothetical protein [bacterium]HNZ73230.1 hypothetical protein [bacterium]HOH67080.1 hypothetical protein [bacterium]HQA63557.1 hypothetical protein [bacterium]